MSPRTVEEHSTLVQNSKELHMYHESSTLVATTVPDLVIIKHMVHKILNGQRLDENQYTDRDVVTHKVIGIIFYIKSTSNASFITIKQWVIGY